LLAPIYGWFTEGFGTRDLQKRRRCSASWRHSGAKPNDDGDFLWRCSQEIGRLNNAGKNVVYKGHCYAAVYECKALIGYGGRFGTAQAVGVIAS
jgi:hypothetical protein